MQHDPQHNFHVLTFGDRHLLTEANITDGCCSQHDGYNTLDLVIFPRVRHIYVSFYVPGSWNGLEGPELAGEFG